MNKNRIHIEINDKKGKKVNDYYIHRLSVRDNFERVKLNKRIAEMGVSDNELLGHLYTCAALSVTLRDVDGNRLYTDTVNDKGEVVEDAYTKLENDLDYEVYGLLITHYLSINPNEVSLDAKKKRS